MPKDEPLRSAEFYQEQYTQGFTTDCPSDEVLASLTTTKFADAETDFKSYVEVMRAVGLRPGDAILDFGCSWGYGSWQLREAGFNVYSYEISKPRALYAKDKLSCNVVESVECLRRRLKCVFSAHVIEHLADPNLIWNVGTTTLEDGGLIVCFCPNGDPLLEGIYGPLRYHQLWGKVHPLLVTSNFLRETSKKHGYRASVYRSPYPLAAIAANKEDENYCGPELCLIAARG
jgi:2-polyprenyl-3-methyl-5-hydroxy-6-metoxy-1,4-benzoquinol methylase